MTQSSLLSTYYWVSQTRLDGLMIKFFCLLVVVIISGCVFHEKILIPADEPKLPIVSENEQNWKKEIARLEKLVAAEIIFKKEISEAKDSEAAWKEKENEYNQLFANPYKAAEHGYIDEVIRPDETRTKLIAAFRMLENKAVKLPRKKHGNIPL